MQFLFIFGILDSGDESNEKKLTETYKYYINKLINKLFENNSIHLKKKT